jgi:hypothetical protein
MLRTGFYAEYFYQKAMKFNVNLSHVCDNDGDVPNN